MKIGCVQHDCDECRMNALELAQLRSQNTELVEALRGTYAELQSVLNALNNERMPHDGDEFHERLMKARAALARVEASK